MLSIIIEADRYILSFFNGSDSIFLDGIVTMLTSGYTWILLYLALCYVVIKNNDTMYQIGITIWCALLCVLLADGLTDGIIKPLVGRPRPLNDPFIKHTIDIVAGSYDRQYSFFSAHATNTFNCWTRLYLGMHYPSDIIVGLMWGACVGFGVWFVFRRKLKQGCDQHDADLLITVFVFTLFMVVMISFLRLL